MRKSEKESGCELWDRAAERAPLLGLSLERERCATINLCDGTFCLYLSPLPDFGPQQVEKFLTRQEKTEEMQLAELRRFLASETCVNGQRIG